MANTGEPGKAINNILSGDNLTGHVITCAALGDGLSSLIVWSLQTFGHADVPAAVSTGIASICMFVASMLIQKLTP